MVDWLEVAKHSVLGGRLVEVPQLQKQRNTVKKRHKDRQKEEQRKRDRSRERVRNATVACCQLSVYGYFTLLNTY